MYKVQLTIRLKLDNSYYSNIDKEKGTFIDLEAKKTIAVLPSKDYDLCFTKAKPSKADYGDVYYFPSDEPERSNIHWFEKNNSFQWHVVVRGGAWDIESSAKEYIEEGWKILHCVVEGKKATTDELIEFLNSDELRDSSV